MSKFKNSIEFAENIRDEQGHGASIPWDQWALLSLADDYLVLVKEVGFYRQALLRVVRDMEQAAREVEEITGDMEDR